MIEFSPAEIRLKDGERTRLSSWLRLFDQLPKLGLLRGGEVVFDANQKHELGEFDFALRGQNLGQLRSGGLLVHLGLFEQRDQALHLVLQRPLKLGEFSLRLAQVSIY